MNETGVFLSLGSNLGDREGFIAGALEALDRACVSVDRRSCIYETEPEGVENQPWFLNQVVHATTSLAPLELLEACKRIERVFGREPAGVRFGPRTLDIDILLYGDQVRVDTRLTLPHPRMHERRFVLKPLVEIAPTLLDPRSGQEYAQVLERLGEGKKVQDRR